MQFHRSGNGVALIGAVAIVALCSTALPAFAVEGNSDERTFVSAMTATAAEARVALEENSDGRTIFSAAEAKAVAARANFTTPPAGGMGARGPCGEGNGDCCDPLGNGTPGCDDVACCEAICAADSFCCDISWDGICASAAQKSCAVCEPIECDPPCGEGEICDDGVCVPAPEGPVNDNCEDVPVDNLSIGECLVYNGDNTGATMTCAAGGFPEVWHAFNLLDDGATVNMGYCGTSPPFGNAYIVIDPECPCSGTFVFATSFDNVTCDDGNWTMHYDALPAGDYWTPILQDATSTGPYTWTICAD
ncbi:MAG: hypothetical protein IID37_07100 [Planctomycetes bacterium]|nr:hypothetical protein [Planctomycetota bacterium]